MKKENVIKMIAGLCLVVAGVLFILGKSSNVADESVGFSLDNSIESVSEGIISDEDDDPGGVCCYVCGAVNNPGVYELKSGSRVIDAIEAAGGFTDEADQTFLNLAELAEDGAQIKVPTVSEAKEAEASSIAQSDGLVNINTAGESELTTLPGIGSARAAAIISYRDASGTFSSKEDIMNVPGIKEASYEKIKDYIKVEG